MSVLRNVKPQAWGVAEAEHRPLSNLMDRIVQEFLAAYEATERDAAKKR